MYSRNTWEKRNNGGYTIPPGYDGSRFRRRRRNGGGESADEVILIPDSGFAPVAESADESDELSVGGIPTHRGIQSRRRNAAFDENSKNDYSTPESEQDNEPEHEAESSHIAEGETPEPQSPAKGEKLSGILEKLGFGNSISSDELLICAIIFLIASDKDNDGKNVGDILLILALLLGIR